MRHGGKQMGMSDRCAIFGLVLGLVIAWFGIARANDSGVAQDVFGAGKVPTCDCITTFPFACTTSPFCADTYINCVFTPGPDPFACDPNETSWACVLDRDCWPPTRNDDCE